MNPKRAFISYLTIVRKELHRMFRVWSQTILPSAVTTTLYFIIFGSFIGPQLRGIGDFSYMQFIVPGLVMMAILTNAFQQVVSGFYFAKFTKSIEEVLVSPTPSSVIVAGYVTAGIVRGSVVGFVVLLLSVFFANLRIYSLLMTATFGVLTAMLFSLIGLLNALYAKNFDQIAIVPTFVLTPLTYLGGVFYSVSLLPPFWRSVSKANPIFYMVNGFRYGFLGISDVSVTISFAVLIGSIVILLAIVLNRLEHGSGLKT